MISAINAAQDEAASPSFVGDPEPAEGLPSVQASPQAPDPSPPCEPTAVSPSDPAASPHPSHAPAMEAPQGANPKSEFLNPKSPTPLLTQEERRQILARLARVNPLDCFDESGAFDLERARHVLPPGSISRLTVHETTRPNAEGQPVTERRIDVGLFNPVSALRLDEQMERRERHTSSSSSETHSEPESDSPPPAPNTPEYGRYLVRLKTRGLEEATPALALLKKALAEKQERQRQLNKELDKKIHQLEVASKNANRRGTAVQSRDSSREAGFATPLSGESKTPRGVEGQTQSLSNESPQREWDTSCQPVPSNPHTPHNSPAEISHHERPRRKREIEQASNPLGPESFASSPKATSLNSPDHSTGAPRPPPLAS